MERMYVGLRLDMDALILNEIEPNEESNSSARHIGRLP